MDGRVKGLDGTVYKQDQDKQGWTGTTDPNNVDYCTVTNCFFNSDC